MHADEESVIVAFSHCTVKLEANMFAPLNDMGAPPFMYKPVLQEHVYFRNIADETPDVLAELLRLEGALPRYNPRILEQPSSDDRYAVACLQISSQHCTDAICQQLVLTG